MALLTSKYQELSNDRITIPQVPLKTFEQLLTTIAVESTKDDTNTEPNTTVTSSINNTDDININNINNSITTNSIPNITTSGNHDDDDDKNAYEKQEWKKCFVKHITRMSDNIDMKIDRSDRFDIFEALFESGLIGSYYTPYLTCTSIINVLKNSFGSFKYNINTNVLSIQSQVNLTCIYCILDNYNIDILERQLNTAVSTSSGQNLENYFRTYASKCNLPESHYFIHDDADTYTDADADESKTHVHITTNTDANTNTDINTNTNTNVNINTNKNICINTNNNNNNNNNVKFRLTGDGLMDVLRNLLFQIGVVCYIFDVVDCENERIRYRNNTKLDWRGSQENALAGQGSTYCQRQQRIRDASNMDRLRVFSKIQNYCDLGLIDTTIQWNGISLYHLFTKLKLETFLRGLLVYGSGDWSCMKNSTGQVE